VIIISKLYKYNDAGTNMIKNKHTLLASVLIMMVQVVWIPTLWSIIENGGLHWLVIRLPLILSIPIGIGLFLSSIENRDTFKEAMKNKVT
jgi:hypothetical protein